MIYKEGELQSLYSQTKVIGFWLCAKLRWPRGTLPKSTFTYLTFDFQKCDFRLSISRILTFDFHKSDFRLSQIRLSTFDFYKSDF